MLRNVYELSTARPHDVDGARWTPPEYRAYCIGYTRALGAALDVMELAFREWKNFRAARRSAGGRRLDKTGAA